MWSFSPFISLHFERLLTNSPALAASHAIESPICKGPKRPTERDLDRIAISRSVFEMQQFQSIGVSKDRCLVFVRTRARGGGSSSRTSGGQQVFGDECAEKNRGHGCFRDCSTIIA